MLILTRRVGESIQIGDTVTITVLGIKGNQVRIGTDAPTDLPVHREEIRLRYTHAKATRPAGSGPLMRAGAVFERSRHWLHRRGT